MKTQGKTLPTRLQRQPIIDAVAEIRFATSVDASLILPGILLKHFPGSVVTRLPASELPEVVRQSDENFKHQPLIRVTHQQFFFLVGTSLLAVGCSLPYPGWSKFIEVIQQAINIAAETEMMSAVTRYSLKYSDVLECDDVASALQYLDLDVQVAGTPVGGGGLNLQFSVSGESGVHLVQIAVIANLALIDGSKRRGALISVDSISTSQAISMADFSAKAYDLYSKMHEENKEKFFSCLNEETLAQLGAEYV